MDWEELRVRVGQELAKRSDLFMYRVGARDRSPAPRTDTVTRPGKFFFSGNDISLRVDLLRKHLPEAVAETLREADEICRHRFRVLGYSNLEFALPGGGDLKEIDWHLDPLHGKRVPLDPWFRIPFLDFAVVGDHKVIWELNRHQHLVTLAKAHRLTADEKYMRELVTQWHSWVGANPYPLGINWGSTLEVAFRSQSWIWVDHLLAGVTGCADFRAELVAGLAFHGHYIERYLSTYFSPNTHLLGEAVALFFLGTLYPQMPGAARWKQLGWKILLRESERQVRRDGVYFEQSLYYHVYALDFFLYARSLAARNDVEIPPAFDAVLGRMLEVIEALAQAGPAEGFGDDDGGRVWNPRRNRTEHMTDPLALGTLIYSKEFSAATLTEEAIWLFGHQAADKLGVTPKKSEIRPQARCCAFPDGGIYVLAEAQPLPLAIMVDAGPQGVGRSGHGHADALSLRLTMDGMRWLIDSGSGVYISRDLSDRNEFRGTGAHNTMIVDGVDQAVPEEAFSWTKIPAAVAENWLVGRGFTYFEGSHNGYTRLADPVLHRRHVMKIAGSLFLVRDVAIGHAEHDLEIRWHFAPDLDVQVIGSGQLEVSTGSSLTRLQLIVPEAKVWNTTSERNGTRVSPAYGAFQSAPLVRCHARVLLPAETAVVFAPLVNSISKDDGSPAQSRLVSEAQPAVQAYECDCPDGRHRFLFALGDEPWSSGPWASDARVLYCRIEKNALVQLVVIGGTYVNWEGKPALRSAGRSAFFEWDRNNTSRNEVPPSFSVTPLFESLVAGSSLPSASLNRALTGFSSLTYAEKN